MRLQGKAYGFSFFGSKARSVTTLALLLAVALILSYLESVVFSVVTLPGVKIGLSNITLTLVVYLYSPPAAFLFGSLKCLLSLLFSGRLSSLFFSASGMLAATSAMLILKRIKCFSSLGVCVCGSVFHIWGQLLAFSLFIGAFSPFTVAPLLTLTAVVAGVIVTFPVNAVLYFYEMNKKRNNVNTSF